MNKKLKIPVFIIIDQAIKIVVTQLLVNKSFTVIPYILFFRPKQNTRFNWIAAFTETDISIFIHLLLLASALVLIFFLKSYLQSLIVNKKIQLWFDLALSGILCSLIDTVFWGGSWDYLLFSDIVIFDLKDMYLNVGIIIFILSILPQYITYYYRLSKVERRKISFINWLRNQKRERDSK